MPSRSRSAHESQPSAQQLGQISAPMDECWHQLISNWQRKETARCCLPCALHASSKAQTLPGATYTVHSMYSSGTCRDLPARPRTPNPHPEWESIPISPSGPACSGGAPSLPRRRPGLHDEPTGREGEDDMSRRAAVGERVLLRIHSDTAVTFHIRALLTVQFHSVASHAARDTVSCGTTVGWIPPRRICFGEIMQARAGHQFHPRNVTEKTSDGTSDPRGHPRPRAGLGFPGQVRS